MSTPDLPGLPGPWLEQVRDERRFAPAVRDWATLRRERDLSQTDRDRTSLARTLYTAGMLRHEIAEVLGIDWVKVDQVLAGKPA